MVNNGSANLLLRDLAGVWESTLQEVRPSLVSLAAQEMASDRAENKYAVLQAVPKPRKWEDNRAVKAIDVNRTFSIRNDTYEVTMAFKGDALNDSVVVDLASLVKETAMSMALFPDNLLSELIRNGATAGYVAYDGEIFYSDAHKFAGSAEATSNDNKIAGTGVTDAAFKADFESAIAQLEGFVDDKDRLINPQIDTGAANYLVHVPPGLKARAKTVLNATIIGQTSNILVAEASVYSDGYLNTDANDWYVHMIGLPQKPFIYQPREKANVRVLDFSSERYAEDGIVKILGRMRCGVGYYRPERSVKIVNS